MIDLNLAQAAWRLGFTPNESLPQEVGIKGLEEGLDSEGIRILASLVMFPVDGTEAQQLFEKIMMEFHLPTLSAADAARVYAADICRKISNGTISPYEGARIIWETSIRVGDSDFHDFDTFIYSASEMDTRPEDEEFFNQAILAAARTWNQTRTE